MHKRCLKRIQDDVNSDNGTDSNDDIVQMESIRSPAKRCRPNIVTSCDAMLEGEKVTGKRVSFAEGSARVVLIDGLGSELIKRQRCYLWYSVRLDVSLDVLS